MMQDTRLARLLHVLLHMHLRGGATTSATIAEMLHTNPVVVRRTMAALRDAGYVTSTGGRGGGWVLSRELDELTVRDVHDAIEPAALFAIGPADDNPRCPVESKVNRFLVDALRAAEQTLLQRLAGTRLSELARNVVPRATSGAARRTRP